MLDRTAAPNLEEYFNWSFLKNDFALIKWITFSLFQNSIKSSLLFSVALKSNSSGTYPYLYKKSTIFSPLLIYPALFLSIWKHLIKFSKKGKKRSMIFTVTRTFVLLFLLTLTIFLRLNFTDKRVCRKKMHVLLSIIESGPETLKIYLFGMKHILDDLYKDVARE